MRIRAVILLTTLAAPVLAAAAYAGPSLHSEDVTKSIAGNITRLNVDADISNVVLTPGDASSVKAHLEWTMERPELSITSSKGVLNIKVRCDDQVKAGGVTVYLVATCVDDLKIVVPAAAKLVVASSSGDILASHFTGASDLRGGSVRVTDLTVPSLKISGEFGATASRVTSPSVLVSMRSGDIIVDHVSGRSVTMSSGNGLVRATDLTARDLSMTSSSGDVSLLRTTASTLAASTRNGTVDATDVHGQRVSVSSGSGDVQVRQATADRLDVSSGNGSVGVFDVKAPRTTATSSSGDVDVQRLRGARLEARSNNGYVNTYDVHVRVLSAHSGSGDVAVQDLDTPDVVQATSGNGNVNIRVPSGRYYVDARSNNGTVRVTGLKVDRFAQREITAASGSGDVSVTGV